MRDDSKSPNWIKLLEEKFPLIAKVYLTESEMKKVNSQLSKRNEAIIEAKSDYETTFYDLLTLIKSDDNSRRTSSIGLLNLLNKLIEEYSFLIKNDTPLFFKLKKQLSDLFRANGAKYLDKVGELACTLYLLKELNYAEIVDLEYKYELEIYNKNSKDADLLFENKKTKEKILIDIFNISADFNKIENEEKLGQFLKLRVDKKRADKRFDSIYVNEKYETAFIQPFVWIFDLNTILKYKEVLDVISSKDSLPTLCLRQKTDGINKFYDCVRIANIEEI